MTDGRTDGQTDGQTDGRTDGRRRLQFLKKRGDNNVQFHTLIWGPDAGLLFMLLLPSAD